MADDKMKKSEELSEDSLESASGGYLMQQEDGWWGVVDDETGRTKSSWHNKKTAQKNLSGQKDEVISVDTWNRLFGPDSRSHRRY